MWFDIKRLALLSVGLIALALAAGCDAPPPASTIRNLTEDEKTGLEAATFAAGCFWGVEARLRAVEGVAYTEVGYTGGHVENPTYKQVCAGGTGHAEAVRVLFDPAQVSYEELLEVFWTGRTAITPDRLGLDVGKQYRSAVFYHTPEQKEAGLALKQRLEESDQSSRPVITEIAPAGPFYRAEEYHQQYYEKTGRKVCPI